MAVVVESSKEHPDLWVGHMRDGDVAVITSWLVADYPGRVVQRYRNALLTLGSNYDYGWGDSVWSLIGDCGLSQGCRVRILPKGTLLRIT